MFFPFGTTVYRLRAVDIPDPYNPDETIPGNWETPEVAEIPGAFIAQSSTSRLGDATRTQALENKSLYCPPGTDIRLGDRVRNGPSGAETLEVDGIPTADINPFTGWQPVREIPLRRYVG